MLHATRLIGHAACLLYLRLIGERLVDFLLVLIELFAIGATAEALRAISTENRRFR